MRVKSYVIIKENRVRKGVITAMHLPNTHYAKEAYKSVWGTIGCLLGNFFTRALPTRRKLTDLTSRVWSIKYWIKSLTVWNVFKLSTQYFLCIVWIIKWTTWKLIHIFWNALAGKETPFWYIFVFNGSASHSASVNAFWIVQGWQHHLDSRTHCVCLEQVSMLTRYQIWKHGVMPLGQGWRGTPS